MFVQTMVPVIGPLYKTVKIGVLNHVILLVQIVDVATLILIIQQVLVCQVLVKQIHAVQETIVQGAPVFHALSLVMTFVKALQLVLQTQTVVVQMIVQ